MVPAGREQRKTVTCEYYLPKSETERDVCVYAKIWSSTLSLPKNCKLRFHFASQIIMWSRRAQGSGGVSWAWRPVWVCRCMCIREVSSEQPVTVVLFSNHFWLALSSSDNTLAWSAPYFFFFTFWFDFFKVMTVNDYDNPAVCCLFDVIFCLCLMILFDFVDAQSIYQ